MADISTVIANVAQLNAPYPSDTPQRTPVPVIDAPIVEGSAVAESPMVSEPAQTDDSAKRLRERMVREKEARQAEIRLREREAKIKEAEDLQALAKKDPFAFFEKAGIDPNDFSKQVLDYRPPTETDKVRDEVESLKKKLAAQEEKERAAQNAEAEKAARDYISSFVSENKDQFPLLAKAELSNFVFEAIQDHYTRTGEVLDEDVAAGEVETWLRSISEKLAPQTSTSPSDGKPKSEVRATTLSNAHAASAPARITGKLSKEESIAEMKKALRFKE